MNMQTTTYQSLLEERTEGMGSAEVDFLWKKMEDGMPYVSVLARPHALEMIKELKAIAQRKHDEELALDG